MIATPTLLPARAPHVTAAERLAAFWRLSREERLLCYRRGELSLFECVRWAARTPHEPPQLNGEWEFIARLTPEVAEAGT
jgi:hypothetical protein